jgi:hypothetical protein
MEPEGFNINGEAFDLVETRGRRGTMIEDISKDVVESNQAYGIMFWVEPDLNVSIQAGNSNAEYVYSHFSGFLAGFEDAGLCFVGCQFVPAGVVG